MPRNTKPALEGGRVACRSGDRVDRILGGNDHLRKPESSSSRKLAFPVMAELCPHRFSSNEFRTAHSEHVIAPPSSRARDPEGGALFAYEIRCAAEAAARTKLPEVAALLWRAVADQKVTEAEAEELSGLIAARQALSAIPKAPRQHVGSRPRSSASLERRRRWAASGWLPPRLAARVTLGEASVLAVVAREVQRRGRCTLAVGQLAAEAGVSPSTVQRALRAACALGLVWVEERRLSAWRNDTNVVTIVSPEWQAWLRSRGGGCHVGEGTNNKSLILRSGRPADARKRATGDGKRMPRAPSGHPRRALEE